MMAIKNRLTASAAEPQFTTSNGFPFMQMFLLAIVRLAEPIALTSIFPYAWALVKHFNVGSEQTASFYSGLLISAFSLAEASMGMYWGALSDRIGRKPVLIMGCMGTTVSLLIVGFATNIWIAILGRAVGGFLNGNIGVIQTMVGEMVTNPEHEPRAYSVMPFVWTAGTIIGPAIGGTFVDPHSSFPNIFTSDNIFSRFPFLLPNAMCAGILFMSLIMGNFLLEETHPSIKACAQQICDTNDSTEAIALLSNGSDNSYSSFEEHHLCEKTPEPVNIFSKRIMTIIISLCIFTYHSMTYDHLLPIFLEDSRAHVKSAFADVLSSPLGLILSPGPGGLGLGVRTVGMVMAANGVIAMFIQVIVFPLAADLLGVYKLFMTVIILHPLAYIIVPSLLFVPKDYLFPAIYVCLIVRNLLSILLYPLMLILIKDATPAGSAALGKINGLAASTGAACRMIAPPIAGFLYTFGSSVDCAGIAWYGSAIVACIGAVQCFWVERPRGSQAYEEDSTAKLEVN